MKKLLSSNRLRNFAVALVIVALGSCSKSSDNPGGGGSGGGTGGTTPATLTVQPAPSFPLWNGDNYSINYSSTNTTGVKVNGITKPSSGTISLTGLVKDSILLFETVAIAGATNASPQTITIPVFKPVRTNLCKNILYWENVWYAVFFTSDGTWHYFPPGCASTNSNQQFFPTGDTCKIFNLPCGTGPNSIAYFNLDNDESHMFLANLTLKVLKSTIDSTVTESADGMVRKGWAARH